MSISGIGAVVSLRPAWRDANALIARARHAQREWRERSVAERVAIIGRFRARLAAEAQDMAAGIGKRPIADTLGAEILPLLEACRFLEKRAARILAPTRPRGRVGLWLAGLDVAIAREPYGTVLIIGPSNYALMLPGVQTLQALAAGNAVLLKPAPGSGELLQRFARMLQRSGLPDGLLVVTDESVESGTGLLESGVDKVVFTGSSETGRAVIAQAASHLVPAIAELSGWDACLVLESADIERTARAIAFALRLNSGQTCMAPRRILVAASRHDALVGRLRELLGHENPVGFGAPLQGKARSLIEEAVAHGAELAAGRLTAEGVTGPLLLTRVDASMPIFGSEVFGPIALVTATSSASAAIELANRTDFGLGASVFGDPVEAATIARQLDVGLVMINDAVAPAAHPAVPIAARRASGFGATRGAEGLVELTRPKAVIRSRSRRPLHLEPQSESGTALVAAYIRIAYGRGWRQRLTALSELLRTLRSHLTREKSS